jgi:hypothetical protein
MNEYLEAKHAYDHRRRAALAAENARLAATNEALLQRLATMLLAKGPPEVEA